MSYHQSYDKMVEIENANLDKKAKHKRFHNLLVGINFTTWSINEKKCFLVDLYQQDYYDVIPYYIDNDLVSQDETFEIESQEGNFCLHELLYMSLYNAIKYTFILSIDIELIDKLYDIFDTYFPHIRKPFDMSKDNNGNYLVIIPNSHE